MVNYDNNSKEIFMIWIYLKGHISNIQVPRKSKHKFHVFKQITHTHINAYIHKRKENFIHFLYLLRTV